MTESVRDGRILLIVALASIPVWFLLSDGYVPAKGFVGSFYHSMYIFRTEWFCSDVPAYSYEYKVAYMSQDCWIIQLSTKYLVLMSVLVATYGYLITSELVPNPFAWARTKWGARKQNRESA